MVFPRATLLGRTHQGRWCRSQCNREANDTTEREVSFATFDSTHVRAVESRFIGQTLLAEAEFLSPLSYRVAERPKESALIHERDATV
jgi:hypothetical protein